MKTNECLFTDEAVHEFFGLSYAHYLVLPRLALQTMPPDWQRRFVECLHELCEAIDFVPEGLEYHVQLRDSSTHKIVALARDPLNDYRHGRCEYKGFPRRAPAAPAPLGRWPVHLRRFLRWGTGRLVLVAPLPPA